MRHVAFADRRYTYIVNWAIVTRMRLNFQSLAQVVDKPFVILKASTASWHLANSKAVLPFI